MTTQGQITFGEQLKKLEVGGFVLTETLHSPSVVLPRHDHECANINLTIKGSFREIIGSRPQECTPLSLLIKPAGEAHSNVYGSAGARCLIIEVTPRRLETIRPFTKLFDRPHYVQSGLLSGLGMRIYNELRAMDDVSPLIVEGLVLELLAQATDDNLKESGATPSRWLVEARELIDERFAESLSLSGVAASVGVHPSQLARMFRKYYRCSVGEYVHRRRLDYAEHALRHSDKSLAEIATDAGFYDQSQFTRAFKQRVRMTPTEFRRATRQRNSATKNL